MEHTQHDILVGFKQFKTNFYDLCEHNSPSNKLLHGASNKGDLYVTNVVGILRLSSKEFRTSDKTKGHYVKKLFFSFFGYHPAIWVNVKLEHTKKLIDQYAIVSLRYTKDTLDGSLNRLIGEVTDDFDKDAIHAIALSNWNLKLNKKYIESINKDDITPYRTNLVDYADIVVSIDPCGSLDIDDAIGLKKISDSMYDIYIHIADPTSYVIENSELDKEVSKRSESVYLRDITHHMFPIDLATEIFSLKKHKISRAFSVIISIDITTKKVISYRVEKTLVNVNENLSYDEVTLMLLDREKYPLVWMLYTVGETLYREYIDPCIVTQFDAKKMVEIYMVIANHFVAKFMVNNVDNIDNATKILIRSQQISKIAEDFKGIDQKILECRRKLNKNSAVLKLYTNNVDCDRHDHLNMDVYTHFTSPIRRYSDVITHRILYNIMQKQSVFTINNLDINLMFNLNHCKDLYRKIRRYEDDIYASNKIYAKVGDTPINLSGIIIDIKYDSDVNIKVIADKVTSCDGFDIDLDDVIRDKIFTIRVLSNKFIESDVVKLNIIRTGDAICKIIFSAGNINIDSIDEPSLLSALNFGEIELFKSIEFKLIALVRDMNRIKTFI